MAKKLLVISFVAALLFFAPTINNANAAIEIIESEIQEVSISVQGTTIRVSGANGQTLHVYNVAGVRIMSIKVDGMDKHYDLNLQKGCYIVQVGKTVKKIFIK